MKVAYIEPYRFLPTRDGGHKACYQFCAQLIHHAQVVCLSTTNNEPPASLPFEVVPLFRDVKTKYINPLVAQRIGQYAQQAQITHFVLNQPFMGLTLLPIARRLGIPLVIYSLNIEYKRFETVGKWWVPLMRWWETAVYRHAQGVMFISHDDLLFARHTLGLPAQTTAHIPYGITAASSPHNHTAAKQRLSQRHNLNPHALWLIFFGTLSYPPNADGLTRFLDEFVPQWAQTADLPYEILICGGNPPPALAQKLATQNNPHLHYFGFVDDITTYVQSADFMVNPIVQGGGVKIKLMDALSWGTTVISTVSGAKGIWAEACGDKLLIHPDDDFMGMIQTILSLAHRPWEPTPPTFYHTYHSQAVAKQTADFLSQL